MLQENLTLLKISKILKERTKESARSCDYECPQLIQTLGDYIFIWCKEEFCLYFQNNEQTEKAMIQILKLSKPPIWPVKRINLNNSCSGILLIGDEGIAVVELPKKWGSPVLFEGGAEIITCRVKYLHEHFYLSNPHIKIVDADWHPGSLDYTHINILSSDNYLRLYVTSDVENAQQEVAVGDSTHKENKKIGIEESCVAFGIGSPFYQETLTNQSRNISFSDTFSEQGQEQQIRKYAELLWPVFVLFNNGDVYYTLQSLSRKRLRRQVVYGPLSMQPSSFDNYGVDFCSLMIVTTNPMVLIIGNTNGFLHHCLVLDQENGSHDDSSVQDISLAMSRLDLEHSNVYLHVYETIRLNTSYVEMSQTPEPKVLTTRIIRDSQSISRYFVYYNEGFYGVYVPLIENIVADSQDFPEKDLECVVEYMLCTRPVSTSSTCFVTGLATLPLGKVVVMLSSGVLQIFNISTQLLPSVPEFKLLGIKSDGFRDKVVDSFEDRIRSIFKRASSQPFFVPQTSSTHDNAEELLVLFDNVTDNLRENYIRPQVRAREEIKRRNRLLLEQKDNLKREINKVQSERVLLSNKAHEIAAKYEKSKEKNSVIMKKLETYIGNFVKRLPTLSTSEKNMLKNLEEINDKVKPLASKLSQIKSKEEWQKDQIVKETNNLSKKQNSTTHILSENQLTHLKISLGKESDHLEALVTNVTRVKSELGV